VLGGAMISMGRLLEKPGPALLWPQTAPRRNFFSISSTIATTVTRILYKGLRLATARSSENFLR
jgi:hypothetical protein